ncbi:2-amino-4-hydroxy-6-hydroxymethyldihydropteridine diphosphokinase [Salinicola avicenniae]|uniref:2-amino-4-hydroxy-6- hydroxymethyldihydropteridine diphosphokinase n=1 Tax=Salinicola avicenniae TaxID=2916836 RepID=UPI002073E1D6|nr:MULTISPECIES: 2-amino-4-hydroxy-6-hydroxymethyldihydropteridine diphosphokinase [unclassified Salinicola]
MPLAVLGLGSNIARHHHLTRALDALQTLAGDSSLAISRVFESPPVGFDDPRTFYNLVVAFETALPPGTLERRCKAIERDNGRPDGPTKFVARTLDIDLLLWGDRAAEPTDDIALPRTDVTRYAFVLHPLAELLPTRRHPRDGRTFAELWASFDASTQPHWPVDFAWQGRQVSWADGG